MEFCCGCWLEGGQVSDASAYHPGFGNIYNALPEFIEAKKVNIVHFRNITSPLPAFDETFIDDGPSIIESRPVVPSDKLLAGAGDDNQYYRLLSCHAGYGDMYALIRSMVAANYNGSIILDHTPSFEEFAGGHAGATSYAVVRNLSSRTRRRNLEHKHLRGRVGSSLWQ